MRLFIGVPLSRTVVEELCALTEQLKSPTDGLRWSSSEGWHITLQFLGNTGAEQYACVAKALRQIRHAAFQIQLEPPGFFDNAGVFFVGVRLSPALTRASATRHCSDPALRICPRGPAVSSAYNAGPRQRRPRPAQSAQIPHRDDEGIFELHCKANSSCTRASPVAEAHGTKSASALG